MGLPAGTVGPAAWAAAAVTVWAVVVRQAVRGTAELAATAGKQPQAARLGTEEPGATAAGEETAWGTRAREETGATEGEEACPGLPRAVQVEGTVGLARTVRTERREPAATAATAAQAGTGEVFQIRLGIRMEAAPAAQVKGEREGVVLERGARQGAPGGNLRPRRSLLDQVILQGQQSGMGPISCTQFAVDSSEALLDRGFR